MTHRNVDTSEGQGHVSAGLAALRAAAGRQAKELDQDEIKQRLARIAGREQGAEGTGHNAGAGAIRDRLNQALVRGRSEQQQKQQHERDEERRRQIEPERQRERDRDLGWEL